MTRYASDTKVSVEKSRMEIESTLRRYGADGFRYGWSDRDGKRVEQIDFSTHDRVVRFTLVLPSKDDRAFRRTEVRGHLRSEKAAHDAWEQACRQRWRALALCIKAKLEAVACGISEFESEFLANIVDPFTNQTMGFVMRPQIASRYKAAEAGLPPGEFIGFPALPAPKETTDEPQESETTN